MTQANRTVFSIIENRGHTRTHRRRNRKETKQRRSYQGDTGPPRKKKPEG